MKRMVLLLSLLLSVFLIAGCSMPGGQTNLTVKVIDKQNNPIEGAQVNVYTNVISAGSGAGTDWRNIQGTISANGVTDQYGQYKTTLPSGLSYWIQAGTAVGNEWVYNGVTELFDQAQESVTITLDTNITVEPTAGDIIVELVDMNGKPLEDGNVALMDPNYNTIASIRTGTDGKVTFRDIPYGDYVVSGNFDQRTGYLYNFKNVTHQQPATMVKLSFDRIIGVRFTINAKDASYGPAQLRCPDRQPTATMTFTAYDATNPVQERYRAGFVTTNALKGYPASIAWPTFYDMAFNGGNLKIDVDLNNDCYIADGNAAGHDLIVEKVQYQYISENTGTTPLDFTGIFAYNAWHGTSPGETWLIKQPVEQTCFYTKCLHYPHWDVNLAPTQTFTKWDEFPATGVNDEAYTIRIANIYTVTGTTKEAEFELKNSSGEVLVRTTARTGDTLAFRVNGANLLKTRIEVVRFVGDKVELRIIHVKSAGRNAIEEIIQDKMTEDQPVAADAQ